MTRRAVALAVLTATLSGAGCGRSAFAPVGGKVTIDGKPAENVVVYFVPEGGSGSDGPTSWGSTDAAGRYILTCMNRGNRGAVVGKHRVVCDEPELLSGGKDPRVPERYRSPTMTPLRAEVRDGENAIDFHLP